MRSTGTVEKAVYAAFKKAALKWHHSDSPDKEPGTKNVYSFHTEPMTLCKTVILSKALLAPLKMING